MASQSNLDCSEAQGLVSSIYQTVTSVSIRPVLKFTMTHVVDTKVVEGLGDLNLLLGIKKGIGELLALTQGTLDDLEAGDIAQEVGDADVVAVGVASDRGVGVFAGLDGREAGMGGNIFGREGWLADR